MIPPWIESLRVWFRYSWQRYLIALICTALVLARIVYPALNVDWISVVLLAIAMSAVVFPRLSDMLPHVVKALPYIKKAKLAGVEVELSDEIRRLAIDVDQANEAFANQKHLRLGSEFPQGQAEVLQELKSDPRAALLLLAARIERQVMQALEKNGLRHEGEFMPLQSAITLGVKNGVFPEEILKPFKEFWSIRNQVAHGMAFDVDSTLVMSLISVGLEVLKLVSVEKGDGPSSAE